MRISLSQFINIATYISQRERERERERESSALLFSLLLFVLCIRTICNAIVSLLLMLPKRTSTASHSKSLSNCADSQEMPNMEAHIHMPFGDRMHARQPGLNEDRSAV